MDDQSNPVGMNAGGDPVDVGETLGADSAGASVGEDSDDSLTPHRQPRRSTNRLLALAIFLVLAAGVALAVRQDRGGVGGLLDGRTRETRARLQPAPPVDAVLYDTRNLPISPESAIDINAKRPLDLRNVVPARAFVIGSAVTDELPRKTALECLAQAIYYEAASESEAGQRAVAQVVLNRVRSPAFPNTVCGVVFQGWTRTTGCQFSFTCDGSMQRVPSLSGMARARRIAGEALAGSVMRAVGNATHYHADYVVPYWAGSLDKVQTVGRHIFYLIRGGLGRPGAFTAPYLGALEQSPLSVLETSGMDLAGTVPGVDGGPLGGATPITNPLAADLAMGKLVAPDGTALVTSTAPLGRPVSGNPEPGAGSALKADLAGQIEGGRSGRLIADERAGALRGDEPPPATKQDGR